MNVSYEGIGHLAVTFPNTDAQVGKMCSMNSGGKVTMGANGEPFIGFVEAVDGKTAAVQIEGFVKVSMSGACPPKGFLRLASDGNGGVKTDSNGKEYLVVATDSAASTITFRL